jgi:hypothetical protein
MEPQKYLGREDFSPTLVKNTCAKIGRRAEETRSTVDKEQ